MAASSTDFKAIILAGGSGERFWPLSTPDRPKQFLRVFGGASLLRQGVDRLLTLVESRNVHVITAARLAAATRRELPELPRANVVGEPVRRDTCAAVALGVARAGEGVLGFFPADQLVGDPARFRKAIRSAIARARKSDAIVTIGIKPTYPATSFGYVDPKSGTFVEKPDLRLAKSYIGKGYLWNAGMFIARSEVFRAAFAACAPEFTKVRLTDYPKLPKVSFDYAVMERFSRVEVVAGDFGWDDVGGYAAFDRHFPHDRKGNVCIGACKVVDGAGNICIASERSLSVLGATNLVIVSTKDGVLVADKSRLEEMKRLFR